MNEGFAVPYRRQNQRNSPGDCILPNEPIFGPNPNQGNHLYPSPAKPLAPAAGHPKSLAYPPFFLVVFFALFAPLRETFFFVPSPHATI
jgi:hypothetical protein